VQDELEQELERLKDKLTRGQKKSSKSSTEMRQRTSSMASDSTIGSLVEAVKEDVCEICERLVLEVPWCCGSVMLILNTDLVMTFSIVHC
jgi:hypothetical protein